MASDNYRVPAYRCVLVRDHSVTAQRSISSNQMAIRLAVEALGDSPNEQLVAFSLDSKNKIIGMNVVSVGVLDSSFAHPRESFRAAILLNAASIIVAHNHPSGDLTPSSDDRGVFRRLHQAGEIVGIRVLDFVIVNNETGIALAEMGA